jgi:hypothetical protein
MIGIDVGDMVTSPQAVTRIARIVTPLRFK